MWLRREAPRPAASLQALSPGAHTVAARMPAAWASAVTVAVARVGVGWHLRLTPAFVFHNRTNERLHVLLTGMPFKTLHRPCCVLSVQHRCSMLQSGAQPLLPAY